MTIAEWGIVGAVLVVILGAFLFFQLKASRSVEKRLDQMREDDLAKSERIDKILKDKDDKLEKANEKLNKVAVDAVKVGTIMSERQNQLIDAMEEVLKLLRRNNGHGKSSDSE